MFKQLSTLALLTTSLFSVNVMSHDRWIVPSHTQLSGEDTKHVAVDLSISNAIFHADKSYGTFDPKAPISLRNQPLVLIAPDGSQSAPIVYTDAMRKSTAGIPLTQDGTHVVSLQTPTIQMTFYLDDEGNRKRVFGDKSHPDLPANAKQLRTLEMHSTIETYVTKNAQTPVAVKSNGLSLSGHHPNDLFVGEPVEFVILQNGMPVPTGTEVTLTPGNTRYRNQRDAVTLTTDNSGKVSYTFPQAGLYLLNAGYSRDSDKDGVETDRFVLFATLEVLPE